MNNRPLILVSNDDGVHAEGIEYLSSALSSLGEIVVVAPDQGRSAASHSITLHKPLRIDEIKKGIWSVDGTPADCVMIAIHKILDRKPDIIVSGINDSPNLGEDIHYSGTVSVAYEGGIQGIPSLAFSLFVDEERNYAYASKIAHRITGVALREGLPEGVILNVNIPDLPESQIKGIRVTRQGLRDYGDIFVERKDPRGKNYYWIGGDIWGFKSVPGSDCNALNEGYVSITPLRVDLTDENALKTIGGWKF